MQARLLITSLLASAAGSAFAAGLETKPHGPPATLTDEFRWKLSPPLVAPADRPQDPCHAIKDPSVVQYQGRWHLFCTIRSQKRTHQIEYLSFTGFENAAHADRHVLACHDGYFCAPQVFYFSPHKRWYLLYQTVLDKDKGMVPACSTSTDISDPRSWSRPAALIDRKPDDINWIDFWIICDDARAFLFFTSLDGRLWRCRTGLDAFPAGWSRPELALRADIFEAAHVYRIRGLGEYLLIVEAQAGDRRYYKAYLADRLEGIWKPLADTRERPFASPANVTPAAESWTDSYSHGELIRAGHDEKLEIDLPRLRFLFQGVSDRQKAGKPYGQIPWRLGLLEATPALEGP